MASRGRGGRVKGADYERRIGKLLSEEFGVEVKRSGAQEQWKHNVGDVQASPQSDTILNQFYIECKNRESLGKAALDWYKKAVIDAGKSGKTPVVIMTKNREDDYVLLSLTDFIKILKVYEQNSLQLQGHKG